MGIRTPGRKIRLGILIVAASGCGNGPIEPLNPDPENGDPVPGSWSAPVPLFTRHARIATGDHLFAVGQDGSGSSAFGVIRSEDGGATWSGATPVSGATDQSLYRGFKADEGTLHLVTRDPNTHHLHYHRSDDGGSTWNARIRITASTADAISFRRYALAVVGGGQRLYLVDGANANGEIKLWTSVNGGQSWDGQAIQLPAPYKAAAVPDVAVGGSGSGDVVHVVWTQDGQAMNFPHSGLEERHSYYRRSPDGGQTWSAPFRLSSTEGGRILQGRPLLSVAGSRVYAIWETHESLNAGQSIWFRRSPDGGLSWEAAKAITPNSGFTHPQLAVGPGPDLVHVVAWAEDSRETYYIHSSDGGVTWLPPQTPTSLARDDADQPFAITVAAGWVHLLAGSSARGDGPQPGIYVRRPLP